MIRTSAIAEISETALNFRNIAKHLSAGKAARLRRFIILDCCFSGAAASRVGAPHFVAQGAADAQRAAIKVKAALPRSGTLIYAASSPKKVAKFEENAKYTMFSGSLFEILKEGDGSAGFGKYLSFHDLNELLWLHLSETYHDDAVRPWLECPARDDGDLSFLPAFPNRAALNRRRSRPEAEPKRKVVDEEEVAKAKRRAEEEAQAAEARRKAEEEAQAAEAGRRAAEEAQAAEARRKAEEAVRIAEAKPKADEEAKASRQRLSIIAGSVVVSAILVGVVAAKLSANTRRVVDNNPDREAASSQPSAESDRPAEVVSSNAAATGGKAAETSVSNAAQPSAASADASPPVVNFNRIKPTPSFDCAKASNPDELLICSNLALAVQDRQFDSLYRAALKRGDAEAIKRAGLARLRERGMCTDFRCVSDWYDRQIAALQSSDLSGYIGSQ